MAHRLCVRKCIFSTKGVVTYVLGQELKVKRSFLNFNTYFLIKRNAKNCFEFCSV
jgi:hypothetical protein